MNLKNTFAVTISFTTLALIVMLTASCSSVGQTEESKTAARVSEKWEYQVFSFGLEVTHRNGFGTPMKFIIDPTQLSTRAQSLGDQGWEYIGIIHAATDLAAARTFVLYRRKN